MTSPPAFRTRAELDLALLRGNFDHAFDLFDAHLAERAATRAQDPRLDSALDEAIDPVEVDLWLTMTDAPRSALHVARFQKLVCR